MAIRTRFAPSPTGRLHLGHALAAFVARDLARTQADGCFLLRMEDIDSSRVRPEFHDAIVEDLQWLGLAWDGEILRQSNRQQAYEEAFDRLRERNLVYPCFCTRKEIQAEIKAISGAPHQQAEAVYPAICQRLSPEEQEDKLEAGLPHAWRLDSREAARRLGRLSFRDHRHGEIGVDASVLGDVVIARKDIGISYHLAVVVDDAHQQITHVTRGEDLLSSTHVHRLLQGLLELPEPLYHHHPLVLDERGHRLAKRSDSLALSSLRAAGRTPAEIREMVMRWI